MTRGLLLRLFAALFGGICVLCSPCVSPAQEPQFVYGATFFYERIPSSQWAASLSRYRAMGINTIDLYVMWNWHELRDGDFDFTGRSNSRRNLTGLLQLIHDDGFRLILRPGPVIRNEWRNGGYPAWLLVRPAYRMPLRDVMEGRYPATATLQNEHSDAAAGEWMSNATHMRYATRWLQRVLRTAAPWKPDILAVALDDDQGAYLDNDTWPGPHFHRYIHYLGSVVHRELGASMPVFINTYQMKVTASSPVWPWGNWYQSDAYSIGEHDRSQLEFTAGLLQTQSPRRAVMMSEFQAGWLQDADQARPRAADPSNTTLALHTLLQMGAHGVVNFPVQDTLNPAGWEAPWTNAFYSWDAALAVQLSRQARFDPTARFGRLVSSYGSLLAQTQPAADAAIAYATSAYDSAQMTNEDIAAIAGATIDAQRGCRIMRITCTLIDLRYIPQQEMNAYRTIVIPRAQTALPYIPEVRRKIDRFRAAGGTIVSSARAVRAEHPAAGGIPNAALLVDRNGRFAFLDIVNYGRSPLETRAARVGSRGFSYQVPAQTVPPRDALLLPLGIPARGAVPDASPAAAESPPAGRIPLREGSWIAAALRPVPQRGVAAYSADVYQDGYPAVVMENRSVRLIVSPCAGARAFVFEDKTDGANLFTTVGGLRDAWSRPLAPSPRDYIAKYTHPIVTGTFNRCYDTQISNTNRAAEAFFQYSVPETRRRYSRSIIMNARERGFVEQAWGSGSPQQITSFAADESTKVLTVRNGAGFYDPNHRRVVMVLWDPLTRAHTIQRHSADVLLTLTLVREVCRIAYEVAPAASPAQAQAALEAFANRRPSTP